MQLRGWVWSVRQKSAWDKGGGEEMSCRRRRRLGLPLVAILASAVMVAAAFLPASAAQPGGSADAAGGVSNLGVPPGNPNINQVTFSHGVVLAGTAKGLWEWTSAEGWTHPPNLPTAVATGSISALVASDKWGIIVATGDELYWNRNGQWISMPPAGCTPGGWDYVGPNGGGIGFGPGGVPVLSGYNLCEWIDGAWHPIMSGVPSYANVHAYGDEVLAWNFGIQPVVGWHSLTPFGPVALRPGSSTQYEDAAVGPNGAAAVILGNFYNSTIEMVYYRTSPQGHWQEAPLFPSNTSGDTLGYTDQGTLVACQGNETTGMLLYGLTSKSGHLVWSPFGPGFRARWDCGNPQSGGYDFAFSKTGEIVFDVAEDNVVLWVPAPVSSSSASQTSSGSLPGTSSAGVSTSQEPPVVSTSNLRAALNTLATSIAGTSSTPGLLTFEASQTADVYATAAEFQVNAAANAPAQLILEAIHAGNGLFGDAVDAADTAITGDAPGSVEAVDAALQDLSGFYRDAHDVGLWPEHETSLLTSAHHEYATVGGGVMQLFHITQSHPWSATDAYMTNALVLGTCCNYAWVQTPVSSPLYTLGYNPSGQPVAAIDIAVVDNEIRGALQKAMASLPASLPHTSAVANLYQTVETLNTAIRDAYSAPSLVTYTQGSSQMTEEIGQTASDYRQVLPIINADLHSLKLAQDRALITGLSDGVQVALYAFGDKATSSSASSEVASGDGAVTDASNALSADGSRAHIDWVQGAKQVAHGSLKAVGSALSDMSARYASDQVAAPTAMADLAVQMTSDLATEAHVLWAASDAIMSATAAATGGAAG